MHAAPDAGSVPRPPKVWAVVQSSRSDSRDDVVALTGRRGFWRFVAGHSRWRPWAQSCLSMHSACGSAPAPSPLDSAHVRRARTPEPSSTRGVVEISLPARRPPERWSTRPHGVLYPIVRPSAVRFAGGPFPPSRGFRCRCWTSRAPASRLREPAAPRRPFPGPNHRREQRRRCRAARGSCEVSSRLPLYGPPHNKISNRDGRAFFTIAPWRLARGGLPDLPDDHSKGRTLERRAGKMHATG